MIRSYAIFQQHSNYNTYYHFTTVIALPRESHGPARWTGTSVQDACVSFSRRACMLHRSGGGTFLACRGLESPLRGLDKGSPALSGSCPRSAEELWRIALGCGAWPALAFPASDTGAASRVNQGPMARLCSRASTFCPAHPSGPAPLTGPPVVSSRTLPFHRYMFVH